LEWRLGEHQENNASMSGVIHTDFARVFEGVPPGTAPRHRFMTIAEWADRESFEKAFYTPEVQSKLQQDLKRISDYEFLISEILIEANNPQ
jgi:hypothetical protein